MGHVSIVEEFWEFRCKGRGKGNCTEIISVTVTDDCGDARSPHTPFQNLSSSAS